MTKPPKAYNTLLKLSLPQQPYFVRQTDDSMAPLVPEDACVLVDPNEIFGPGDIVYGGLLKRQIHVIRRLTRFIGQNGKMQNTFVALNGCFEEILLNPRTDWIYGKCVRVQIAFPDYVGDDEKFEAPGAA